MILILPTMIKSKKSLNHWKGPYVWKFVGGSPANIAVGVTKHGMKAGLSEQSRTISLANMWSIISMNKASIRLRSAKRSSEKLGLTFTEMLSSKESNILMYRNQAADLQLSVEDIDEDYLKRSKHY